MVEWFQTGQHQHDIPIMSIESLEYKQADKLRIKTTDGLGGIPIAPAGQGRSDYFFKTEAEIRELSRVYRPEFAMREYGWGSYVINNDIAYLRGYPGAVILSLDTTFPDKGVWNLHNRDSSDSPFTSVDYFHGCNGHAYARDSYGDWDDGSRIIQIVNGEWKQIGEFEYDLGYGWGNYNGEMYFMTKAPRLYKYDGQNFIMIAETDRRDWATDITSDGVWLNILYNENDDILLHLYDGSQLHKIQGRFNWGTVVGGTFYGTDDMNVATYTGPPDSDDPWAGDSTYDGDDIHDIFHIDGSMYVCTEAHGYDFSYGFHPQGSYDSICGFRNNGKSTPTVGVLKDNFYIRNRTNDGSFELLKFDGSNLTVALDEIDGEDDWNGFSMNTSDIPQERLFFSKQNNSGEWEFREYTFNGAVKTLNVIDQPPNKEEESYVRYVEIGGNVYVVFQRSLHIIDSNDDIRMISPDPFIMPMVDQNEAVYPL